MERSPGSVIEIDTIEVDGKVYFNRFFCALSPCITGFLTGCRPYLSVDSTALNGLWKGYLASAIAIDGNNWMYPIAFGFFDAETTDNWTWFMIQLLKAIGKVSPLAICTDACKGLEIAVHRVFPWAGHRECFNHLTQNLIKKYGGSVFQEMYPVARSYRAQVHEECMDTIKKACTDVALWLDTYHKLIWYRSGFNVEIKCDYVTNNLAECFNNWIRDIKALPICELADTCREMIMTLWNRRRRIGNKFTGTILPAVLHQLRARTRGLGHLSVVHADITNAEVWDNSSSHARHVVRTHEQSCTCQEWQHTGKPCQHALAVIASQQIRDVKLENYINPYYSVALFWNAYNSIIEPLPDKSQWPKVDLPFVLGAPLAKRNLGRYRKLRIKGCLEGGGSKPKDCQREGND